MRPSKEERAPWIASLTASRLLSTDYEIVVDYYFSKNFLPMGNASLDNLDCTVVNSIEDPKYVLVKAGAQYKTFFLKIISIEKINVHSQAQGRLRKIK